VATHQFPTSNEKSGVTQRRVTEFTEECLDLPNFKTPDALRAECRLGAQSATGRSGGNEYKKFVSSASTLMSASLIGRLRCQRACCSVLFWSGTWHQTFRTAMMLYVQDNVLPGKLIFRSQRAGRGWWIRRTACRPAGSLYGLRHIAVAVASITDVRHGRYRVKQSPKTFLG
jgi:hypothetical protein